MPAVEHDLVGHDAVRERLAAALRADRLPHGLLFAGPVGVGKATVARWLAGRFLSDTKDAERRIAEETHPDFHLVTRQLARLHDRTGKSKAVAMTADVVRAEVVRPAARTGVEGKGKVFVIEEAATMNAAAQNALLKTLEEPAGRTLIVLLTDRAESLLPTVRSRCQTHRFGELSHEQTLAVLARHGVRGGDAEAAIGVAGGSPGQALAFLNDGVVERARELWARLDDAAPLAEFMQAAAESAAEAALKADPLGSKDAATRAGHRLYLGLAADHLRRRLPDSEPPRMLDLCDRIDAVDRCDRYLAANVNTSLALRQLELALRS